MTNNPDIPFILKDLEPEQVNEFMRRLRRLAAGLLRDNAFCSLRESDLIQDAMMRKRKPAGATDGNASDVDDALERLYDTKWENRDEFLSYMCKAMKSAMYDYVRKRTAQKRQHDSQTSIDRALHNRSPETINRVDELNRPREKWTLTFDDLNLSDLIKTADRSPERVAAFCDVMGNVESHRPEWAQVIYLRDYLQLPWRAIAEQFDSSEDAARKRHSRAFSWVRAEVLHQLNQRSANDD